MLDLQAMGAHNINLVTPTHYADKIRDALDMIRGELKIPVVYNTGGYESESEISKMAGYVDVFLTDMKYYSPELSRKYSLAADYYKVSSEALLKMLEICPECDFDENGIMRRGVILRHLVLPSHRADSIKMLEEIAKICDISKLKLSLMSQYTPDFYVGDDTALKRKITTFEYQSVVNRALELGYDGYIQEKSSANKKYTPDFSEKKE
jgi:putative pyruvate formate lyase activating enzyme